MYGKCRHFLMSWRLTVVHSYSKKMLESGDNQIKKKGMANGRLVPVVPAAGAQRRMTCAKP
jgi:hypothetical protein